MNTIDCIKSRRSVRKFTEEKVPHEVLEQLVELSRWAIRRRSPAPPSARKWRRC